MSPQALRCLVVSYFEFDGSIEIAGLCLKDNIVVLHGPCKLWQVAGNYFLSHAKVHLNCGGGCRVASSSNVKRGQEHNKE